MRAAIPCARVAAHLYQGRSTTTGTLLRTLADVSTTQATYRMRARSTASGATAAAATNCATSSSCGATAALVPLSDCRRVPGCGVGGAVLPWPRGVRFQSSQGG